MFLTGVCVCVWGGGWWGGGGGLMVGAVGMLGKKIVTILGADITLKYAPSFIEFGSVGKSTHALNH